MNNVAVVAWPQWREPREVFAQWKNQPHCVWLDTASGAGGLSILAAAPGQVICTKGPTENPFPLLAAELQRRAVTGIQSFPTGAAIGYFSYDLKNHLECLRARAVDDLGLPDCWFGFYEHLLVFDHARQTVWEVGEDRRAAQPPQGQLSFRACEESQASGSKDSRDSSQARNDILMGRPQDLRSGARIRSNLSREEYCGTVRQAKDYIAAGDIYQVNLSQRFQCHVDIPAPELYDVLRHVNPAPYCAYLDLGDAQILSSSPECFLNISGREVVTRPIKGTRPRSSDPRELLDSAKDNAELLMITDLERNDLGRVCEFGSVHVRELKRVESFATVHHLVSTVAGRLRPEVSHVDCVRACFPGGSITGAPKIRAMEIIDELEPHARGVYTGAIGFFGFNGLSHLNIAIRTLVYQHGRLTFHAGGGIVADSEPEAEYEETLAKARGIINAIDQLRVR